MSEAALFPKSWPLILDFFEFFIPFYVCPDPNPAQGPLRQKVAVPVPVTKLPTVKENKKGED